MVQLALKKQVIDNGNFERYENGNETMEIPVEIYVDRMLMNELEPHGMNAVVDVKKWKRFGREQQELSLKIEN